jgi:uncharacterized cupredoxin-like copper-binding protein
MPITRRAPGRTPRASILLAATAAVSVAVAAAGCAAPPAATPRITPGTSEAAREVNVIAKEWTFVPPVVDLVPGETVVLHLLNGGTEPHEWVFGDARVQAAWEVAEAATAGAPPGPTPVVSVAPGVAGLRVTARSGERVDVQWTVPEDGPSQTGFIVGCHIPGHFANGMAVPVRWVGPDGVPLPTEAG